MFSKFWFAEKMNYFPLLYRVERLRNGWLWFVRFLPKHCGIVRKDMLQCSNSLVANVVN